MERDVSYEQERAELLARSRSVLAEPVGYLVAMAYEPRVDGVDHPPEFDVIVEAHQRALRNALRTLTPSDGGAVESVALEAAKALLAAADRYELDQTVGLLHAALRRCDGIDDLMTPNQRVFSEPERVPGPSGKPIGLWR